MLRDGKFSAVIVIIMHVFVFVIIYYRVNMATIYGNDTDSFYGKEQLG